MRRFIIVQILLGILFTGCSFENPKIKKILNTKINDSEIGVSSVSDIINYYNDNGYEISLNRGGTPPQIEGSYSGEIQDSYGAQIKFTFLKQNALGKILFKWTQWDVKVPCYISGSGDSFTVFGSASWIEKSVECKRIIILSGTKVSSRLDLQLLAINIVNDEEYKYSLAYAAIEKTTP